MGIDVHGLNFLRNARKKKPFGDTMTIGRLSLHVIEPVVKELVAANSSYIHRRYCEELLQEYFGSTSIESIDNSSYENATHIHDMNESLPANLCGKYDTVIDAGTLEHVYNVPQALRNCSMMCRTGGQILHLLPANNCCGHGFWQFSPELFFSLYSESNGYRETEVFLADMTNASKWYQVRKPSDGQRVNVRSSTELYVLARTVLTGSGFSHARVQQSDYVHLWERARVPEPAAAGSGALREKLKKRIRKAPLVHKLAARAYHAYRKPRTETGLNPRNPGLVVVRVDSYLSR